ncbi:hypothetical protein ACQEVF_22995 [Nonomuraea polychroma]|uniref:hypothetical protein n=1 Tax=Nonomuraea polychroma TaxID=46176 RepID=UPI003D91F2E1
MIIKRLAVCAALALASLSMVVTAPAEARSAVTFDCHAPNWDWNNNCFKIEVPGGHWLWIYNRTSQATDIEFRLGEETIVVAERTERQFWQNRTSKPVTVTVGVQAKDLDDSIRVQGRARTVSN